MGTVVDISAYSRQPTPPCVPDAGPSLADLTAFADDAFDRMVAAWLVFGSGPSEAAWLSACFDQRLCPVRRGRLADAFRERWPDCDHVLIHTALGGSDPVRRRLAVRCTGSSRYVGLLGEALLGRDRDLAALAAEALARAGCPRAGRFLSARILDEQEPARLAALLLKLRHIPGAEVDGVLRHHLAHRHAEIRLSALHGCRDRRFAEDVARVALADEDARVRVLAVSMLTDAADLEGLAADPDPTVRRLVRHACGLVRRA